MISKQPLKEEISGKKQKTLFLMVGCPASGKSTFIKKQIPLMTNARVISRDEIRFSLVAENEPYFSREDEVFDCFINEIREAIKTYDFVFVDATHINGKSRLKTLKRLYLNNDKVAVVPVVFTTPLETCLLRNEYREGRRKVPEDAIKRMYNSLTMPNKTEYEYDYSSIWLVNEDGEIETTDYNYFKGMVSQ